jgi:hypothetical protein
LAARKKNQHQQKQLSQICQKQAGEAAEQAGTKQMRQRKKPANSSKMLVRHSRNSTIGQGQAKHTRNLPFLFFTNSCLNI